MKRMIAALLAVLLVSAVSMSAAAAGGQVTYSGRSGEIIFAPGSDYSPTDLFDNFKGVMPGDTVVQPITVRNNADDEVKVKIYMRSLGAHADSQAFLSQLHLKVRKAADNEMAYMFDAAADQTAGLTDWVLLGTLYSGGEVNLEVVLDVPTSLGNEFQDAVGYLDWEFAIVEEMISPDDPKPPPTGRSSAVPVGAAVLAGAALVFFLLLIVRKKKKEQEQEQA